MNRNDSMLIRLHRGGGADVDACPPVAGAVFAGDSIGFGDGLCTGADVCPPVLLVLPVFEPLPFEADGAGVALGFTVADGAGSWVPAAGELLALELGDGEAFCVLVGSGLTEPVPDPGLWSGSSVSLGVGLGVAVGCDFFWACSLKKSGWSYAPPGSIFFSPSQTLSTFTSSG